MQAPECSRRLLVIACGALAAEVMAVLRPAGDAVKVRCLPARWHNEPENIPAGVRALIDQNLPHFERIFVAYGDCGTAGVLDKVLAEYGIERLPGPHCYSFYAGTEQFEALIEAEPGSFFVTDYLLRNFQRLVIVGLGLDRYPQLLETYFGNYRRLVYLAQCSDESLKDQAQEAARQLGLELVYRTVGYGMLGSQLVQLAEPDSTASSAVVSTIQQVA